ncbi:helix-turn-helix domain-containing protein [Dysosmobacter sp.]|uniref:helix-turn-helix domain-containing protein n=1 Tax=Dysosmobacter sp. TaxID=2591382 RepID=UPI003AF0B83C
MNKERLGNFISGERKTLGLTQRDLAVRLHVTDKAVSKWERGMSYPDVTLLEPLAAALDLTVEELMACRRQAVTEKKGAEETMQNLLDISRDSVRQERRRSWKRLAAVLALLAVTAAVVAYTQIVVKGEDLTSIFFKETVDGTNYVYVQMDMEHLLKLKCGNDMDFDAIQQENAQGEQLVYHISYRWNRLTYQGELTGCESTSGIVLGTSRDMLGNIIGLDISPETQDALFGFRDVSCRFDYVETDPAGRGQLWTYSYLLAGTEEVLLTVENILADTYVDYDSDGVTELIVRTRWVEKPYAVYDMEGGEVTVTYPDTVDGDLTERLMTDAERQLGRGA